MTVYYRMGLVDGGQCLAPGVADLLISYRSLQEFARPGGRAQTWPSAPPLRMGEIGVPRGEFPYFRLIKSFDLN
jgi:hypothetical protein